MGQRDRIITAYELIAWGGFPLHRMLERADTIDGAPSVRVDTKAVSSKVDHTPMYMIPRL
ncbi:hypothetical protein GJ744_000257 [Endocarpon pusillum]|uniref:Uncharacterized protein n=1 Tax=Endocarpon pusillum TaxID=364733 RepID=A0A8H7AX29_9EURO|nr:hypothetical protein GJ744_000257 [Endocarpon pusillum]